MSFLESMIRASTGLYWGGSGGGGDSGGETEEERKKREAEAARRKKEESKEPPKPKTSEERDMEQAITEFKKLMMYGVIGILGIITLKMLLR